MPIRKSNDTLFYLIGTIPVVWLALLLAQSLGGGLPELLRNLTSALEQPTNIIWTDKSLPTILICLAAYGMAVLLYRTNQGRTRDGEEHGSAAWATPASVNAQFAQKDSIPLTQHVRLGLDTHKHPALLTAQQCRARTQSAARLPSLAPHGVRRGCWMNRIAGVHGEAMYTAPTLRSVCSYSSCKLPMSGGEGGSPRPFSWGCKGDILFREREYPPFPRPPHGVGANRVRPAGAKKEAPFRVLPFYSTVTDFARLRGLSISHPRWSAI